MSFHGNDGRNDEGITDMNAKVGDWLVMKGTAVGQHDQRGLITEVRNSDGSPPYLIHWLESDHLATVFPGADAIVVTAAEQRAADERANQRMASLEHGITHHYKSD
jgi:hypothetical protein